jgi:hypothetical protein
MRKKLAETKSERMMIMKRTTRTRKTRMKMEKKRMRRLRTRQLKLSLPIRRIQRHAQLLSSSSWTLCRPSAQRYPTRHIPSYSCSSLRFHHRSYRSHHLHLSNSRPSSLTSGPPPTQDCYQHIPCQIVYRHMRLSSSTSSIIPVY